MQVDYTGICVDRYLRYSQQPILTSALHPRHNRYFTNHLAQHPSPGWRSSGRMSRVVMVYGVVLRDKLGPKLAAKAVLLFLAFCVWVDRIDLLAFVFATIRWLSLIGRNPFFFFLFLVTWLDVHKMWSIFHAPDESDSNIPWFVQHCRRCHIGPAVRNCWHHHALPDR